MLMTHDITRRIGKVSIWFSLLTWTRRSVPLWHSSTHAEPPDTLTSLDALLAFYDEWGYTGSRPDTADELEAVRVDPAPAARAADGRPRHCGRPDQRDPRRAAGGAPTGPPRPPRLAHPRHLRRTGRCTNGSSWRPPWR